ncbi:hypothetical protein SEVIR_3G042450v4 [Setaria viridis]
MGCSERAHSQPMQAVSSIPCRSCSFRYRSRTASSPRPLMPSVVARRAGPTAGTCSVLQRREGNVATSPVLPLQTLTHAHVPQEDRRGVRNGRSCIVDHCATICQQPRLFWFKISSPPPCQVVTHCGSALARWPPRRPDPNPKIRTFSSA